MECEQGADCTTSPDSTIIAIKATSLNRLEAGQNLLTLVFEHETIDLAFTLLKSLPPVVAADTIPGTGNAAQDDTTPAATPSSLIRGIFPTTPAIDAPLILAAAIITILKIISNQKRARKRPYHIKPSNDLYLRN